MTKIPIEHTKETLQKILVRIHLKRKGEWKRKPLVKTMAIYSEKRKKEGKQTKQKK